MDNLNKQIIPRPFGTNISPADVETGVSGGDSANEGMSWWGGFPYAYGLPLDQGGKYVSRSEMNSILFAITQWLFALQNGGLPTYADNVRDAIGGYPAGAILWYNHGGTFKLVRSTVNGNMTTPFASGANWTQIDLGMLHNNGGNFASGNATFTSPNSAAITLRSVSTTNPSYDNFMQVAGGSNASVILRSGSDSNNAIVVKNGTYTAGGRNIVTRVKTGSSSNKDAGADGVVDLSNLVSGSLALSTVTVTFNSPQSTDQKEVSISKAGYSPIGVVGWDLDAVNGGNYGNQRVLQAKVNRSTSKLTVQVADDDHAVSVAVVILWVQN